MPQSLTTDQPSVDLVNQKHSNAFAQRQGWLEHDLTEPHQDLTLFLEKISGGHVLDAGCGWGRLAYHFLDAELDYTGIDHASAMIEAAGKEVPDARFLTMSTRALAFPDASFDGVWCCCILSNEPKHQLADSLREFRRVLKPGGLLHIVMPYERCSYEQMVYSDDDQPLLWYASYDPDEMAEQVIRSGFANTKTYVRHTENAFAIVAQA